MNPKKLFGKLLKRLTHCGKEEKTSRRKEEGRPSCSVQLGEEKHQQLLASNFSHISIWSKKYPAPIPPYAASSSEDLALQHEGDLHDSTRLSMPTVETIRRYNNDVLAKSYHSNTVDYESTTIHVDFESFSPEPSEYPTSSVINLDEMPSPNIVGKLRERFESVANGNELCYTTNVQCSSPKVTQAHTRNQDEAQARQIHGQNAATIPPEKEVLPRHSMDTESSMLYSANGENSGSHTFCSPPGVQNPGASAQYDAENVEFCGYVDPKVSAAPSNAVDSTKGRESDTLAIAMLKSLKKVAVPIEKCGVDMGRVVENNANVCAATPISSLAPSVNLLYPPPPPVISGITATVRRESLLESIRNAGGMKSLRKATTTVTAT